MTEKSNIKSSIINFLNQKLSRGALLIDGQWGTGKTYFIKNELIPYLVEEKKTNVIYLSLFGLSSGVELKNAIIAKSLIDAETKSTLGGKVKDRVAKIVSKKNYLSNFISAFEVSDLVSFKDVVFIFDDIERVHSEELLLDFMGIITSSLIEENDYKVIIIGNLNKIENNDFFIYQEKVISRVIRFRPDVEKAIQGILSKISKENSEVHKLLSQKKDFIISILDKYRISNFRTIIQSIDIILSILKEVNQIKDFILLDELIYFTLIINNEYRNTNVNQKFWVEIKGSMGNWPFEDLGHCYVNWWDDLSDELTSLEMKKRIRAYFCYDFSHLNKNSDGNSIFIHNAYHLIMNGIIDEERLNNEIEYLTELKKEKLENQKYDIVSDLYNWEDTKSSEFDTVKKKALSLLSDKKTPIITFVNVIKLVYDAQKNTKGIFDDIKLNNIITTYQAQDYIEFLRDKNNDYLENLQVSIENIPKSLKDVILNDINVVRRENNYKLSVELIEDIRPIFKLEYYDKFI